MKQKNIVLLLIIVVSLIFTSGCVQENAKFIGNFIAIADENNIEARFSLFDDSRESVTLDGSGEVRIENSNGETIYMGTINVKKEDYGTYSNMLSGEVFDAYVWKIPITEIKKTISTTGTIYLKFKTKNAEFEEIEDSIYGLPTYTDEEINQIYENNYLEYATILNEKYVIEGVEFLIERMGTYTHLEYGTWGDEVAVYRIDLKVENIGSKKISISSNSAKIIDSSNQEYNSGYDNTLEIDDMAPGSHASGYLLFETSNITINRLEIGKYIYDLVNKKGYTINQLYDEQYANNVKNIDQTIRKGNFEVNLVKSGFYTHLKYDTWGDEVTVYRIDLKIKNIGSEKDTFRTYDSVIISETNQYDRSYNSELSSLDIHPGIVKEGYLVYEDVPNTLGGDIKIIAGTSYDESYNKLIYEFNVKI